MEGVPKAGEEAGNLVIWQRQKAAASSQKLKAISYLIFHISQYLIPTPIASSQGPAPKYTICLTSGQVARSH